MEKTMTIIEDWENDKLLNDLKDVSCWACCRGHAVLEQELDKIITTLEELRASTSCQSQDFPAELALRDLDLDN
jgi:hypothetical protein